MSEENDKKLKTFVFILMVRTDIQGYDQISTLKRLDEKLKKIAVFIQKNPFVAEGKK